MITFNNITGLETYAKAKKQRGITFEYVPNTAAGYEKTRCYINSSGYKYFVSAMNEKDYFVSCEDKYNSFSVWFSLDLTQVTIKKANYQGRHEKSDKYLKKYMDILTTITSCIIFDRVAVY